MRCHLFMYLSIYVFAYTVSFPATSTLSVSVLERSRHHQFDLCTQIYDLCISLHTPNIYFLENISIYIFTYTHIIYIYTHIRIYVYTKKYAHIRKYTSGRFLQTCHIFSMYICIFYLCLHVHLHIYR